MFNFIITYIPLIVQWLVFAAAVFIFIRNKKQEKPASGILYYLAYGIIGFRLAYALLLTLMQYYVWNGSGFTRLLLNMPLEQGKAFFPEFWNYSINIFGRQSGYFLYYSFMHFWLSSIIAIALSGIFYSLFKMWKSRRPWVMSEDELALSFLSVLLVGWPGFVIFLPLSVLLTMAQSAAGRIIFKKERTQFGYPMIFAILIVLVLGTWLIEKTGFGVLKI
jgi:hypothetical protein